MKTVAIIQARMGSSRLAGKVLRRVGRQAILTHVLARARAIPGVDEVHVTTTPASEDDAIVARCRGAGVKWTRGQVPLGGGKNDVLAGYFVAARASRANVVVRVTSDCPLLDPAVGGLVVATLRADSRRHYASNVHPPSWYDGCDVEAFTTHALEFAVTNAASDEREHVTTWMHRHLLEGQIANVRAPGSWAHVKLSVDTATDLERVRRVWDLLPHPHFGWRDVVRAYRQAYPPSIVRRARKIFINDSANVRRYLYGAWAASRGRAATTCVSRSATLGYEDVVELGHVVDDDDALALEDLLRAP